ncbi:MAG TPA: amidohydrolase family protein, partial [Acidimicrobiales bacterium]|nr:amidohydrolase family protein [Acidimicrobiales bacterium]
TQLLSHWVRREEVFSWEEGVRLLSAVPAALWGFADRGLLAEGYRADLVVFDPDRIGPAMPTVEHDLPAGGGRLVQRANGIRSVLVNGTETFHDGQHTGQLAGRLLRQGRR